jgi:hypothetical protein
MPRNTTKAKDLVGMNISAPKAFVNAVKKRARALDLSASAHIRRLVREDLRKAQQEETTGKAA